MKDTETALSARYYIAEGSIWVLGGILVVAKFFGIAPNQILPILNVTLEKNEQFPKIVAVLLIAALIYMTIESKQSLRTTRFVIWHGIRFCFTFFWAVASLWLAYPLITMNTPFAAISPAWYLGFVTLGILIGLFTSNLAFSAIMIRSLEESKRLSLPRVPAATKAQFFVWIPVVLILTATYYLLISLAPPIICGVSSILVAISFILVVIEGWVSLFISHDEHGERIPYAKRVEQFKEIHNAHDYSYFLISLGIDKTKHPFAKELGIPLNATPKTIQQSIQNYYSTNAQSSIKFNCQLMKEIKLQTYPKDGNPDNNTPSNIGIKINKHLKNEVRVLYVQEDSIQDKKEITISTTAIERHAEEYIRQAADLQKIEANTLISQAINNAVLETLVANAGPLLHRLVESGQEEQILELLKQEIDVNERAEAGWTALLYAVAQGYPRIVKMLLDAGANPDISNVNGVTPLMYGARYGNIGICQVLLEYGALCDIQDKTGMTALIVSVHYGHQSIVELLLNEGADSDLKMHDGKTALDIAYACKYGKIAKVVRTSKKMLNAIK